MKNLLFEIHKSRHWHKGVITLLICIFGALLYFHGEIYAKCESIHPDEIMDFPFSIFSFRLEEEKTICSENRDVNQFPSFIEIQVSLIHSVYTVKPSFFLESTQLKDFKKRLAILQRYIS